MVAKALLIYAAVLAMLLPYIYFALRYVLREGGSSPFTVWAKASAWVGIVFSGLMLAGFTFAVGDLLFLRMTGVLHG